MTSDEPLSYANGDETLRVDVYAGRRDTLLELVDVPTSTFLYCAVLQGRPSDDECRQTALSMMYKQRPTVDRELDDERTLDCIAAFLRRPEVSGTDFVQEVGLLINPVRAGHHHAGRPPVMGGMRTPATLGQARPLYLATASTPAVRRAIRSGAIGQIITPAAGHIPESASAWCIDNGAYSIPEWTLPALERWSALLDRYQHSAGQCLWVTVPDVVGDAAGTDELWGRWWSAPMRRGYRAAYVAQDGCRWIPTEAPPTASLHLEHHPAEM